MNRWLLLFEDGGWRDLRPLTDLVPVPALVFGASNLASRWRAAAGLPLLAIEARRDVIAATPGFPSPAAAAADDQVVAINAAALPGPWARPALEAGAGRMWHDGDRIAAARLPFAAVRDAIGTGEDFARALAAVDLPAAVAGADWLAQPWDLVARNAAAIIRDLADVTGGSWGEVHRAAVLENADRVRIAEGARIEAVLQTRGAHVQRYEFFDIGDTEHALARFAELCGELGEEI